MQETQVLSLGWEYPLEKEMATSSIIRAWRIPWTEEPGELQSMGSQRARPDWVTNTFHLIKEGNESNKSDWVFFLNKKTQLKANKTGNKETT